jgi:hypothetical protein
MTDDEARHKILDDLNVPRIVWRYKKHKCSRFVNNLKLWTPFIILKLFYIFIKYEK